MKIKNQGKRKKIAMFTGLFAVGVLAVSGICLCLYKEKPADHIAENEEAPAEILQVDSERETPSPEPSDEFVTESSLEEEPVVSTEIEPEKEGSGSTQPLQEEPVKTEDEKPTEPPAESTEAVSADVPPENTDIPAQTEPTPAPAANSGTPQHGTIQDGKIYLDGFGWVDYNGGATEVIPGDGIYENGNTVGIMD